MALARSAAASRALRFIASRRLVCLFLKVICDNSGCIYSDSSIGNSSKSSSGSNCGIAAFRGVVAKECVYSVWWESGVRRVFGSIGGRVE